MCPPRGALGRRLAERLDRSVQGRTYERPAEAPRVFRVDVCGHRDLAVDRERLRTRITIVRSGTGLDPAPLGDRRVGVVPFPWEGREAHQPSGLAVDAHDRGTLHRELVRPDGLREHEDVALGTRREGRAVVAGGSHYARERSTSSTTRPRPRAARGSAGAGR